MSWFKETVFIYPFINYRSNILQVSRMLYILPRERSYTSTWISRCIGQWMFSCTLSCKLYAHYRIRVSDWLMHDTLAGHIPFLDITCKRHKHFIITYLIIIKRKWQAIIIFYLIQTWSPLLLAEPQKPVLPTIGI